MNTSTHSIDKRPSREDQLVIIPDIHGRDFWREAVRLRPDAELVFLGDYLDPYPHEQISRDTAFKGLQDIIAFKEAHPDRVTLLLGNHDLHYLYLKMISCRFDYVNADRNSRLFREKRHLFKIAHEAEAAGKRFLFSHAGVGRRWISQYIPTLESKDLTADLLNGLSEIPAFVKALGDVSFYRGGRDLYGSMVWADVNEHMEERNRFPDIVQVFGHTMDFEPLNCDDQIYCLDCCRPFELDRKDGVIRGLDGTKIPYLTIDS